MTGEPAEATGPLEEHMRRAARYQAEAERLERRGNRISLGRLFAFLSAVVLGGAGLSQGSTPLLVAGGAGLAVFFALVGWHLRVLSRRDATQTRHGVHSRHLERMAATWTTLPSTGRGLLPARHPYDRDLDVLGEGSLFQRIDVSHTVCGARALARWLGVAAEPDVIAARQAAIRELAPAVGLREDLEAAARGASGEDKLDHAPFLEFVRRPSFYARVPWLVALIHALPVCVLGLYVAGELGVVPWFAWLLGLVAQVLVLLVTGTQCQGAFDLVAARRGYIEAFARALTVVEEAKLEAPLLRELQARMQVDGRPPSAFLRRLDRWAGLAELRTQFPLNIVANVLVLWDAHVLWHLERWNEQVGPHVSEIFEALGEVEALSSLAGLAYTDPLASYPEIADVGAPLELDGVAHPLLPPRTRVDNDVALRGPGTALIVTGSNMAGKSTLLRAVGLNVALALAGGPVIARRMRLPMLRLRASMRADDSLQRGASYFHAELTKLRGVVEDAEHEPPILFLLDELLRGTNARARHLGARAVLRHLLDRGATGIVATHDVALSELEQESPDQVENVHFTDVMIEGEMTFDYRLRPGVVRTSNALRLLRMAGVDVPAADDPLFMEMEGKQLPSP